MFGGWHISINVCTQHFVKCIVCRWICEQQHSCVASKFMIKKTKNMTTAKTCKKNDQKLDTGTMRVTATRNKIQLWVMNHPLQCRVFICGMMVVSLERVWHATAFTQALISRPCCRTFSWVSRDRSMIHACRALTCCCCCGGSQQ